jgi:hypothetical protein
VFRRKENRKKEIYQYCEDNGIDVQEEFWLLVISKVI